LECAGIINEYNWKGLHNTWFHVMSLPDFLKLCLGFELPCLLKTDIQALIFLAGFGCCKEEVVEKTD
jgi:hypothetical protein